MAFRTTIYLPDDADAVLKRLIKATKNSVSSLCAEALILAEQRILKEDQKRVRFAKKVDALNAHIRVELAKQKMLRRRK